MGGQLPGWEQPANLKMPAKINKLYKAELRSGHDNCPNLKTVYVVAESYAEAERKLFSDNNTSWNWGHNRRIGQINEIDETIII